VVKKRGYSIEKHTLEHNEAVFTESRTLYRDSVRSSGASLGINQGISIAE